ncbi:MAG: DUF402 domain-containing protein [Thermomicrobiales bacterium]
MTEMPTPVCRDRGDQVLLRYFRTGQVSFAYPATVVADGERGIMLFLRAGSPMKRRVMPDGRPIPRTMPYAERSALAHTVGDTTWQENHALILFREGFAHDIRLFWRATDWAFKGFYVNPIAPPRRTPIGFDTADHILDLVVHPDRSWTWKDEDDFADAVAYGRFTAEEAAAVRAEAARLIPEIEAGVWPFDGSLVGWRPDPAWTTPAMPETWNEDFTR